MYILPQFLEIEAKKLLKIELSKIITDITDDFIENLFIVNPDYKYQNIMLKLDEKIRGSVIKTIKEVINIFDNLYFNCDERKKYFNKCSLCHRSIVTIFGELEFDRIYYYDKHDRTKHFYFIDTLFKLPTYDRYDVLVKAISIDNAINTNQKKGAEITNKMLNSLSSTINDTPKYNISRQDIHNWINKWNLPEIEYSTIEDNSDTLYVMVDEKYIHEQIKSIIDKENVNNSIEIKNTDNIKTEVLNFIRLLNNPNEIPLMLPAPKEKKKNYIMSKVFVTFTGIKQEHGRRTLINKTTFLTASSNPWVEFVDFVSKIYDFSNYKAIKVLSDAGTWIVNGISNLKLYSENEIIHCLCEFHVKQKINRITKDENQRRLLKDYVINDNKRDFISLVNDIKDIKNDKRKNVIESYKNYIIKYWKAFRNMLDSNVRSSMESHICHNVAKYFSFEPKAYSRKCIQKLLKLQEYKANGINIMGLYLKTYNNVETTTIKKEELNFNLFDNFSSNLPMLYSENSLTRLALRGLSC
jgi:hypothetical protein